ncbi:MAG: hypothetical protein R2751_04675 [Bacteroidales bacterium]
MNKECELLEKCGFFLKYCNSKSLACKGFISQYCKGDLMSECKRLQYRKAHGSPPSDDMMPTGQIISVAL